MARMLPPLSICKSDYDALTRLVETIPPEKGDDHELLMFELERAELWPDDLIPPNVVTMYSTVEFEERHTKKTRSLQLTFPSDANIEESRVSVLAPTGAALLGLRVGQEISWPLPGGKTGRFRIKRVTQRPRTFPKLVNA